MDTNPAVILVICLFSCYFKSLRLFGYVPTNRLVMAVFFLLLSFSHDINASFNFNGKIILFMKFLNDEGRNSFSTKKCHISTPKFLTAQLDRFHD